jgi:large subunit ribosomal protein L35
MPKLKTDRGAAKRFRRTAKGYKHRQSNRNHILTKKPSKRKRRLRGLEEVSPADTRIIDKLLPTKAR